MFRSSLRSFSRLPLRSLSRSVSSTLRRPAFARTFSSTSSSSLNSYSSNSRRFALLLSAGVSVLALGAVSRLSATGSAAADPYEMDEEEIEELDDLLGDDADGSASADSEWASSKATEPLYDPRASKLTSPNLVVSDGKAVDAALKNRSNQGEHIIVEVYGKRCGACLMFSPIVNQIAVVLDSVNPKDKKTRNPIRIIQVESNAELPQGILTPEEEMYTPVFKLFPASSSANPVTYQGPSNARAIVDWLNQQLPADQQFDIGAAYSAIERSNEDSRREVEAAYETRWKSESSHSPSLQVAELAPCASHLSQLMKYHLTMGYRSFMQPGEESKYKEQLNTVYDQFHACREKKDKELQKFWEEIRDLAGKEIVILERNRKLRDERKGNEKKDSPAQAQSQQQDKAANQ